MQKFLYQLDEHDRRIARKWRLASVGLYGSILAGMLLYTAFHWNPQVNYAAADSRTRITTVGMTRH